MSNTPETSEKAQSRGSRFFQEVSLTARGIRWGYLLVAFCLSITLWYTVTVRDKVESWTDVQLVFKGAPENLVISDGLINKLAVRVRAARGLSRSLIGRESTVVVDLSAITRGSNAIAITRDMLPFNAAYEVIEISPSRIQVVADITATHEIELETGFSGKLPTDMFVASVSVTPPAITVSGADRLVSNITRVRVPVALGQDMSVGRTSMTVAVPAPTNVTVAPPQVTVDLDIGIRVRRIRLTRVVTSGVAPGEAVEIPSAKVTIVADIPETIAKNQDRLADIVAYVTLSDAALDTRTAPVSVTLPEYATLISVTPAEVTIPPTL